MLHYVELAHHDYEEHLVTREISFYRSEPQILSRLSTQLCKKELIEKGRKHIRIKAEINNRKVTEKSQNT